MLSKASRCKIGFSGPCGAPDAWDPPLAPPQIMKLSYNAAYALGQSYKGSQAHKDFMAGGACPNYTIQGVYQDGTCVWCGIKYHCDNCKRSAGNMYGTGHGIGKCKTNKPPVPLGITFGVE